MNVTTSFFFFSMKLSRIVEIKMYKKIKSMHFIENLLITTELRVFEYENSLKEKVKENKV